MEYFTLPGMLEIMHMSVSVVGRETMGVMVALLVLILDGVI